MPKKDFMQPFPPSEPNSAAERSHPATESAICPDNVVDQMSRAMAMVSDESLDVCVEGMKAICLELMRH